MRDWRTSLAEAAGSGGSTNAPERPRSVDILRAEALQWLDAVVVPALKEVADEFRALGRRADVGPAPGAVGFVVRARGGARELDLKFRVRVVAGGVHVLARELVRDGHNEFVREWPLQAPVAAVTPEMVIEFVVARYRAATAPL